MNGKVARGIRKYTTMRWNHLAKVDRLKIRTHRRLYKLLKEVYYQQNRSIRRLVKVTMAPLSPKQERIS